MQFENTSALVTGASGLIGSHLVDRLVEQGCRVHALVRETSNLRWLPDSPRVRLHKGDITRSPELEDCLGEVDYIFHCAGLTIARSRREFFRVNAESCKPFYENCLAKAKRVKAIVHLSSLAAVGPGGAGSPVDESAPCHPITHYGQSKLAGEEIARYFSDSLPIVILRPPVVYGPREENFFTYLKMLAAKWNIRIGYGRRELSLIYVHDLVSAMTDSALSFREGDNTFFVTDGKVHSWEEVARTAMSLLQVRARTITIPEGILMPAALLCEALSRFGSKPALFDRQRMLDIRQSSWTASSEKFFKAHPFRPAYGLERGLAETLAWYKERRWL